MNNKFEEDYKDLLVKALTVGSLDENRTGVKAYTLFAEQLRFDTRCNLVPIITGKKILYKKAWYEYQWIKSGGTDTKYLNYHGIRWWDKYADSNGNLPKTYGHQLRNYNGEFDQLDYCINQIKQNSRRAHITMWNPSDLEEQVLPCCYTGLTFVTTLNNSVLNLSIDFRSSDLFLGLPYDILFGFYLLMRVAFITDKKPGEIVFNLNNAHVYENHKEGVEEYIASKHHKLPTYIGGHEINYKHGSFIQVPLNN